MEMKNRIGGALKDLFSGLSEAHKKGLEKCLQSVKKPVEDSVFVDYGGGCGILSLAARLIGFNTVICNDIYEKSLIDAKTISKETGIPIDHFYNLDSWFKSISKLNDFTLIFVTGAIDYQPDYPNKYL